MIFPDKYRCLSNNTFTEGEYSIVPIRYEDRFHIMKWRNEQIYHLRQNKPLTEEDQENYFRNTVSKLFEQEKPEQILLSYLRNGECIGYGGLVHINWIDQNAEISFIMNTTLEDEEFELHWTKYLQMIEKIAFEELNLHKIFTYAFDIRPHLYSAIEKSGFAKEAVLKSHCLFHGKYKDVIIHSKIDFQISFRPAEESDVEITFKWANDITTRQNSFNSDAIEYANHINWYKNKIKNPNANYFIAEIDGNPAGLIRFDTTEEKTTIGILVDKQYRGRRLASKFLILACENFRKISNNTVSAFIKKENIASVKSFEKAGFRFKQNTIINNHEAFEYEYR